MVKKGLDTASSHSQIYILLGYDTPHQLVGCSPVIHPHRSGVRTKSNKASNGSCQRGILEVEQDAQNSLSTIISIVTIFLPNRPFSIPTPLTKVDITSHPISKEAFV